MKHILLAVSGMTPQIITETIYGIYRQDPSKLPTQIEVLTTTGGRERLTQNLLGPDSPLLRLQQDYQLPAITFSAANIHVPVGDDGTALDDVRTEREQEIITNFITNRVRELSADNATAIHASLAGGRKTMGFALGYAMSLFGRPQDCLSHVLVNAPYEMVPDFYYPTPKSVWRADAMKKGQHDLSLAEVTLGIIPLVLMRQEMPVSLMTNTDISYTQTVARINKANRLTPHTASVRLDFARMSIWCDGEEVRLKPDGFAFYSWLAQDSKAAPEEGIDAPNEEMGIRELDSRMRAFLCAALPAHVALPADIALDELHDQAIDQVSRVIDRHDRGMDKARNLWILQNNDATRYMLSDAPERDPVLLSKNHKNLWTRLLKETNQALSDSLGDKLASFYHITTISSLKGEKSRSRFDYKGLRLLPQNILC
ncbi:MAG: CRISPR-associated ring nuclease Csm6 [Aeromonas sp.]